jgi:hypothetical protein
MEKGDYTVENVYQGGYSSLDPSHGEYFSGYRIPVNELGAPTKPDTANQIQEVNKLLNQGIVPIEIGAIQPEIFDQIPKQHFKEINRMAKLTGAKISIHAPIVEPSGITEQGFSESNRELIERQLNDVVEKSIEVDNKGGMPITIHSSGGLPGTEYNMTPEGKKIDTLVVINQENGKRGGLPEETSHIPEIKEKQIISPEKHLDQMNKSQWVNSLINMEESKQQADNAMKEPFVILAPILKDYKKGDKLELTQQQELAIQKLQRGELFLKNTESAFNSMYDQAYKFSNESEKKKLNEISTEWIKETEEIKKQANELNYPFLKSQLLDKAINKIRDVDHPNLYIPIEDFAVENSSKTFANVAFNAFKKHKDKAPTISIENMFPGMAFSQGKEMKNLIEKSREKFVEKAIEEGISKSLAKEKAEKLIGMTLDVGHLNIAKKKGYEDKDLLKEVREIEKYVKHVHLTDNFGYADSHLPPGMGNVPNKEILEKLEKAGFEGRKIVEAGGFVQHFGTSPYIPSLEAMGSPIYSEGVGPYWNQSIGLQQNYSSGYGQMLPQINYETFGAGFSQLPMDLGGQRQGAQGGRVSGTPME